MLLKDYIGYLSKTLKEQDDQTSVFDELNRIVQGFENFWAKAQTSASRAARTEVTYAKRIIEYAQIACEGTCNKFKLPKSSEDIQKWIVHVNTGALCLSTCLPLALSRLLRVPRSNQKKVKENPRVREELAVKQKRVADLWRQLSELVNWKRLFEKGPKELRAILLMQDCCFENFEKGKDQNTTHRKKKRETSANEDERKDKKSHKRKSTEEPTVNSHEPLESIKKKKPRESADEPMENKSHNSASEKQSRKSHKQSREESKEKSSKMPDESKGKSSKMSDKPMERTSPKHSDDESTRKKSRKLENNDEPKKRKHVEHQTEKHKQNEPTMKKLKENGNTTKSRKSKERAEQTLWTDKERIKKTKDHEQANEECNNTERKEEKYKREKKKEHDEERRPSKKLKCSDITNE